MLEMKLISLLPSSNLRGAVELLNQLKWNISLGKKGNTWQAFGGEKCLLVSSSEEGAHAFVYGLALAYSVLPEVILDQIRIHAQGAAGE